MQRDRFEIQAAIEVYCRDNVLKSRDDPLNSGNVLLLEGKRSRGGRNLSRWRRRSSCCCCRGALSWGLRGRGWCLGRRRRGRLCQRSLRIIKRRLYSRGSRYWPRSWENETRGTIIGVGCGGKCEPIGRRLLLLLLLRLLLLYLCLGLRGLILRTTTKVELTSRKRERGHEQQRRQAENFLGRGKVAPGGKEVSKESRAAGLYTQSN